MILSTVSGNILPEKLPHEWWFEGLVRHCLKNYLENKENLEGT